MAVLFRALFVLQYADLHSTLTASASQVESSRILLYLVRWMPLVSALFLIKGISFLGLFALQRAWARTTPQDDLEKAWLAVVTTTFVVYALIVVNNYTSR